MESGIDTQTQTSRGRLWTGRILGGIGVLFMLMDATIHIIRIDPVVESFHQLGYPIGLSLPLGILELALIVLYLIPRTAVLGAVLLTGYLGGAVSAQLRIEAPLLSTALFPIYIGMLLWFGLSVRDSRVRAFLMR
jgi:hypothetical protein